MASGARAEMSRAISLAGRRDEAGAAVLNWERQRRQLSQQNTIIVLNNGVLAYQKDAETVQFGAYTTACHFAPVDHASIARACGCVGVRVVSPSDIRPALCEALRSNRPTLIEVMTDPEAHPPISLYDGTLDKAASTEVEAV